MARRRSRPARAADENLHKALKTAYAVRAKTFLEGMRSRNIDAMIATVRDWGESLAWPLAELGISEIAFARVKKAGVPAHEVFCHPAIVQRHRQAIEYYRNLAALSKKGLAQPVAGSAGQQQKTAQVRVVNELLSTLVEATPVFDLALARSVIPAEIGTELQGTWVNIIGRGAAGRVRTLLEDFVARHDLAHTDPSVAATSTPKAKQRAHRLIVLKNRWTILFGDEPDVAIRDGKGVLRIAIEIKGSMDRAGAQTRYGEAKKSFAKALAEHAQCETIYLASCFTDAVFEQIRADAQVRRVFNLVDVLADETKQQEFLDEIFRHHIRIVR